MPVSKGKSAAPAAAQTATSTRRFQLPALEFKFASLTDGTDIPPPLPSPIKEVPTPPQTPPPQSDGHANGKLNGHVTKDGATNGSAANGAAAANGGIPSPESLASKKRSADQIPPSPTLSSSRPGSIRKLISRTWLNGAYSGEGRPPSRAGAMSPEPAANGVASSVYRSGSRRNSGWFRRLRSGESSNRMSVAFEEVNGNATKKPAGPPPPMIPELAELETKANTDKEEGVLGRDWIKEIKVE